MAAALSIALLLLGAEPAKDCPSDADVAAQRARVSAALDEQMRIAKERNERKQTARKFGTLGSIAEAISDDKKQPVTSATEESAKLRQMEERNAECAREQKRVERQNAEAEATRVREERQKAALAAEAAEEAARREEAAARSSRLDALLADSKRRTVLLSGMLCRYQAVRTAAVNEIRTEQKYARELAGVVNASKMLDLQNQVRQSDEQIAAVNKGLKGAKPLSCKKQPVALLADCIAEAADEEAAGSEACEGDSVAPYLEALQTWLEQSE